MTSPVLRDARDGQTHAWVTVDGEWWSLCGLAADPDTLTDPGDRQHVECMLKLGEITAGRLPDGTDWR